MLQEMSGVLRADFWNQNEQMKIKVVGTTAVIEFPKVAKLQNFGNVDVS